MPHWNWYRARSYVIMSARLLKKVLKEQEAALRQQEEELYNGHESESPDSSTPPKNPFDLLDDDNDDYDVVDPDSDQVSFFILFCWKIVMCICVDVYSRVSFLAVVVLL